MKVIDVHYFLFREKSIIIHIHNVLQLRSRGSHGVIELKQLDIRQGWPTVRCCIGAGHMPQMSLLSVFLNPTLKESGRAMWKQTVEKRVVQISTFQTGVDTFFMVYIVVYVCNVHSNLIFNIATFRLKT
jgi:hypothetical protein